MPTVRVSVATSSSAPTSSKPRNCSSWLLPRPSSARLPVGTLLPLTALMTGQTQCFRLPWCASTSRRWRTCSGDLTRRTSIILHAKDKLNHSHPRLQKPSPANSQSKNGIRSARRHPPTPLLTALSCLSQTTRCRALRKDSHKAWSLRVLARTTPMSTQRTLSTLCREAHQMCRFRDSNSLTETPTSPRQFRRSHSRCGRTMAWGWLLIFFFFFFLYFFVFCSTADTLTDRDDDSTAQDRDSPPPMDLVSYLQAKHQRFEDKKLRTISELCLDKFPIAESLFANILSRFRRPNLFLMLTRDEMGQIAPVPSLLTHGLISTINFFPNPERRLRSDVLSRSASRNTLGSPTGAHFEREHGEPHSPSSSVGSTVSQYLDAQDFDDDATDGHLTHSHSTCQNSQPRVETAQLTAVRTGPQSHLLRKWRHLTRSRLKFGPDAFFGSDLSPRLNPAAAAAVGPGSTTGTPGDTPHPTPAQPPSLQIPGAALGSAHGPAQPVTVQGGGPQTPLSTPSEALLQPPTPAMSERTISGSDNLQAPGPVVGIVQQPQPQQPLPAREKVPGEGLLQFRKQPFAKYMIAALLRGRPLIIHTNNESLARDYVHMLSVFVAGAVHRPRIVPFRKTPVTLFDFATIKLIGLAKTVSIPKALEKYVTVYDPEGDWVRTCPYTRSDVIDDLVNPKKIYHPLKEPTYLSYVQYVLCSVSLKAFLYYHLVCAKTGGGLFPLPALTKEEDSTLLPGTPAATEPQVYVPSTQQQQQQQIQQIQRRTSSRNPSHEGVPPGERGLAASALKISTAPPPSLRSFPQCFLEAIPDSVFRSESQLPVAQQRSIVTERMRDLSRCLPSLSADLEIIQHFVETVKEQQMMEFSRLQETPDGSVDLANPPIRIECVAPKYIKTGKQKPTQTAQERAFLL
eukprot:TRINITY_DN4583_c0_g1_i4.p1 TRINITY_DN4583_c0_g1~~TRINITY_DN4583_c0_g1_i4.p1  ORF type:complete len:909 (+),score=141.54 TRINITY_DN4583_c0_g1_i4:442-3168(+)